MTIRSWLASLGKPTPEEPCHCAEVEERLIEIEARLNPWIVEVMELLDRLTSIENRQRMREVRQGKQEAAEQRELGIPDWKERNMRGWK